MNKSVLFVHDSWLGLYEDNVYGIHYTNELVSRYSYFGSPICFLTRGRKLQKEDLSHYSLLNHPNFEHVQIPHFRSLKHFYKKGKARSIIEVAVEKHDIIIVRLPSSSGAIALEYARKLEKPVLVEFVTCTFDSLWNYDWRGKLMAPLKYYKTKKRILQATHVIYVTEKFLQSRYPSPSKSIGCSDVELPPISEEILTARLQKIKANNSPLRLITVGALDVPFKGQATVIKALAALKQKNILFQYDLVGQGEPKRLQKLIDKYNLQDRIKIIGILTHKEVFNALKKADIYVQPSKQEGLPRAVIEAMSMALPVIGADTGGIPELLEPPAIYRKRDPQALVKMLTAVNIDFQEKHAKVNFEKAKEFQKTCLDKKRQEFYKVFKQDHDLC